jgi:hypothetical protein
LGHTNIKTTENYLDSFEREVKKDFSNRLLAFKDVNKASENKNHLAINLSEKN